MAIKFEEKNSDGKPAKKEVGGKTYVAEEPAPATSEPAGELPFGKPVRPEKKGRRK